MLEFYHTFYPKKFRSKAKELATEISAILEAEEIKIKSSGKNSIGEYRSLLDEDTFQLLNQLYYTIRSTRARNHFLLKRYLPELRKEPDGELLFADFFSGAGGLSQGIINGGFQPAFVNDANLPALETYYFNHTLPINRFFAGDVTELISDIDKHKHLFSNIKLVAGGPPCQGFSMANRNLFELDPVTNEKRFIEDPRNKLYKIFVQLLGIIQPDFFIMENVRGLRKMEKEIERDISEFTGNIYSYEPFVLKAQDYGIPQNRERYILIGARNYMFLEQLKKRIKTDLKAKSGYKLKDALFGLPEIKTNPHKLKTNHECDDTGYAIRKHKPQYNAYLREINKKTEPAYLFNHKSRFNNENDLEIFMLLPQGGNSLHPVIAHLNKYKNRDHIFKDKYYKLKEDEICKTITSHMKYDCHMYIHPHQPRGLSPREAARVQTFPDDYVFRGTVNEWYQQIGNAVPVRLAEIISKEIRKYYL